MLATVRNISPCIGQAASQVSCLLMVASRAKISRPDAATSDFFVAIMSARKLSRSERVVVVSVLVRAAGLVSVILASSRASKLGRAAVHPLTSQIFFADALHGMLGIAGNFPIALFSSHSPCELHDLGREEPCIPCIPCRFKEA